MFFRRRAVSWIALGVACVAVGCAKNESTPSTESTTASGTGSGTPTGTSSSSASGKKEYPAEVPAPRSITNLDSLRASLDTFYHGTLHRHEVPAICADKTIVGGCIAEITIQAIGLSKDIRADRGPERGRVIGEIRNLDSADVTTTDSLKPTSKASYYIYMDRAGDGHARWNLLEVPREKTGSIRMIVQNEVKACGEKPGYEWPHSDVDLSSCGQHAFAAGIQPRQLLTATGLLNFITRLDRYVRAKMAARRTKWYGCNGGCCV